VAIEREALREALDHALAAHREYERKSLPGVRDERRAGWCAAYVLGRLGDFVPPSVLTHWLEAVQAKEDWTDVAVAHVLREIERGAN
jgi:hypothetical protein